MSNFDIYNYRYTVCDMDGKCERGKCIDMNDVVLAIKSFCLAGDVASYSIIDLETGKTILEYDCESSEPHKFYDFINCKY